MKKSYRKYIHAILIFASFTISHLAFGQIGSNIELNVLWQDQGGTDLFSSIGLAEATSYTTLGQLWYLPVSNLDGTSPLYRLFNETTDHMDSTSTDEGGYTLEATLGYPWTSEITGTLEIIRGDDSDIGDHAEIPPYDSLPGYSPEGFSLYAYPRYNSNATVLTSVSSGSVEVDSNAVSGGAVWNWIWGSTQFLNQHDYGRLCQSAFFTEVDDVQANPTEAGDQQVTGDDTGGATVFQHGCPLLSLSTSGTTQTSSSIPLDFIPENFGGSDQNPILWQSVILGKSLQLSYDDIDGAAQYTTKITVPSAVDSVAALVPTGYVTSNFDQFYSFDASSDTLTLLSTPSFGDDTGAIDISFGGVILADSTGDNAMGVYGVDTADGGSISDYDLFNFNDDSGSDPSDGATMVWQAAYFGSLASGTNSFNAYVVTGTLDDVQTDMEELYSDGAH